MSKHSRKTVPGYGTSLRQQLEQLGWSQSELAERSGITRQTISRAVNHDEVSDRTAERIAAALGRVPEPPPHLQSRRTNPQQGPRSKQPRLYGAGLCDATDLESWADRRAAQALLPKLVRRLVLATGNGITEATFRADEGVQLSGWDGIVRADGATPFVPAGVSGWEMSVGAKPKTKAEENLTTRTENHAPLHPADTKFIFVTPRRWTDNTTWAKQQTDKDTWLKVRVFDADDLASWLEMAPAVHRWLSIMVGKRPPDTVDLESYWRDWSGATRPALTQTMLLAGRDDAATEIREHLRKPDQPFGIRTESRSEAIAVLYAVLSELPVEEAEAVLARALVVNSAEVFRRLTGSVLPLVLMPTFDAGELVPAAARAGHSVVVPLGAGDPESDTVVQLPPLSRRGVVDVLDELGFERDRAYEKAALARRSLTAFRRTIAVSPGLQQPEWAKPAEGRSVLPALLAGSWNGARPSDKQTRDRQILAALARRPYEELQDDLIPWSEGPDPVVRRRGNAWYLVSHEDAFRLLGRYMAPDDLERFEQAAMTVLGTVRPRFDLPVDQRWMAGALADSPEYSNLLSRGLAETLAIMGVLGEATPSAGSSARDIATRVVRRLLEAANENWKLWASLSERLPLLAEAAPDAFLDGVEDGLSGPQPVLAQMFTDEKSALFASSPHTGLLWALESLAWSAPHLGRVVQLLAGLDRVDPGSELRAEDDRTGRLSNRPLASLEGIFRSWLPETSATLQARLQALDRLRGTENEIAWAVMLSMLPRHHAAASPSSRPSFADWAFEARQVVTYGEIAETTKEVVSRLRADAGSSGARWADLVNRLETLPAEEHEAVVRDLEELDVDCFDGPNRAAIWSAMRQMVVRHRTYRGAEWAMPEARVQRLGALTERFAPSDPITLYGWLFGHHPHLPRGEDETASWEERREALRLERIDAVEAVLADVGLDALVSLARQVEDPHAVGDAVGSTDAARQYTDRLLILLDNPSPALSGLAVGFVGARRRELGEDWVTEQLKRPELKLTPDQQATLLQALPATPKTWKRIQEFGDAVWSAYWRSINAFAVEGEHSLDASDALLAVGRPFAAVDLLGVSMGREGPFSAEVVAKALGAVLTSDTEHDRPTNHFAYAVGELLDALHAANFDQERLARLEWGLLPVLDRFDRSPRALHSLLAERPDFFVEVLSLVYRAEDDEPAELSPQEQEKARVGYSLLQEWRHIPGLREDGTVDAGHLGDWIATARELLSEVNRISIGLHIVGQVFSGSPSDPDGSWPCEPVRDIIEDLASRDLDEGIRIGVYNGRGVVQRDPAAGGAQERALADRYDGLAAAVSATHQRTARVLRLIAEGYRRDARREDFESELGEDLGA